MNATRPLIAIGFAALAVGAVTAFIPRQFGADITANAQHQCQGTEEFTCAPDSLVSAYSWIGKTMTERQMVVACETNRYGTTMEAVAKAVGQPIQPFPLSAPGRTFVVGLIRTESKNHMICAHGEADGWTVNDPALDHPQHWVAADFEGASGCVEVKQ